MAPIRPFLFVPANREPMIDKAAGADIAHVKTAREVVAFAEAFAR